MLDINLQNHIFGFLSNEAFDLNEILTFSNSELHNELNNSKLKSFLCSGVYLKNYTSKKYILRYFDALEHIFCHNKSIIPHSFMLEDSLHQTILCLPSMFDDICLKSIIELLCSRYPANMCAWLSLFCIFDRIDLVDMVFSVVLKEFNGILLYSARFHPREYSMAVYGLACDLSHASYMISKCPELAPWIFTSASLWGHTSYAQGIFSSMLDKGIDLNGMRIPNSGVMQWYMTLAHHFARCLTLAAEAGLTDTLRLWKSHPLCDFLVTLSGVVHHSTSVVFEMDNYFEELVESQSWNFLVEESNYEYELLNSYNRKEDGLRIFGGRVILPCDFLRLKHHHSKLKNGLTKSQEEQQKENVYFKFSSQLEFCLFKICLDVKKYQSPVDFFVNLKKSVSDLETLLFLCEETGASSKTIFNYQYEETNVLVKDKSLSSVSLQKSAVINAANRREIHLLKQACDAGICDELYVFELAAATGNLFILESFFDGSRKQLETMPEIKQTERVFKSLFCSSIVKGHFETFVWVMKHFNKEIQLFFNLNPQIVVEFFLQLSSKAKSNNISSCVVRCLSSILSNNYMLSFAPEILSAVSIALFSHEKKEDAVHDGVNSVQKMVELNGFLKPSVVLPPNLYNNILGNTIGVARALESLLYAGRIQDFLFFVDKYDQFRYTIKNIHENENELESNTFETDSIMTNNIKKLFDEISIYQLPYKSLHTRFFLNLLSLLRIPFLEHFIRLSFKFAPSSLIILNICAAMIKTETAVLINPQVLFDLWNKSLQVKRNTLQDYTFPELDFFREIFCSNECSILKKLLEIQNTDLITIRLPTPFLLFDVRLVHCLLNYAGDLLKGKIFLEGVRITTDETKQELFSLANAFNLLNWLRFSL